MILIADSGSTKTDWCLAEPGGTLLRQITTKGINPFFQTEEEIGEAIRQELLPHLPTEKGRQPEAVFFYGAGCTPEKAEVVRQALTEQLARRNEHAGQGAALSIEVCTDMLAAARALCGHRPGIACILGTGSNSCFYDGTRITANVSPLGFILGDEGSGACLGKLLVGDLLKNQLPATLREEFLTRYRLTPADIIDRVYRRPFPNRFLAGLSPFLARHLDEPGIRQLVLNSFKAFLRRNVMQYDYRHHPAHFIGSIAYHYRDLLTQAAEEEGVRTGEIGQSPMEGLIRYHGEPL